MRQFGEQKRAFGNRDSLPAMRLGGTEFRWGERTYIMGVINVSPDSFSGDGISGVKEALEQAKRFVAEGADILDIGGESTRPDSKPVTEEEEIRRVVPVIEAIIAETRIPLSVDTYKPLVAERALEAGALMINHIWGLKKGQQAGTDSSREGRSVDISNQREEPAENIIPAVIRDLEIAIARALSAGVSPVNIIIDPGIGFGKTVEQNLELIYRLGEIRALGKPVLLGTSRKSVIGRTLGLPEADRLEGTAATVAVGIAAGADIIRVHDVKAMKRVARMSDAIVRRS